MAELYLLQLKTYFLPSPGETFTIIKIMILIYIPCLPRRPLEEKSYKSAAGQTAAAATAGLGLAWLESRVYTRGTGGWHTSTLGDSRWHVLSCAVMPCHVLS